VLATIGTASTAGVEQEPPHGRGSEDKDVSSDRLERRLTAILIADVAGFSRLVRADDEGTIARLKAHRRSLFDPKIEEHRGRIVKTTGDGLLAEFSSAVNALRCAIEVQNEMNARNAEVAPNMRIEFRIGVNVGDIIIDDDDILGDGVNVAARLESIAEPGGICVSGRVREDAESALDVVFEDAGFQNFKNIGRLVPVYRVHPFGTRVEKRAKPPLALPDKPSIAVLPFQNMSGDPDQDYFADGIVEDIITALARNRWLFVIARNSSFTYKGRPVDVKQVGRELGVRYVLEGSVRKTANRVRITGQLIDAATSVHIWADYFDAALEHIFELQDEVTAKVVGQIAPKLQQAEIQRARRKPTESLDAYDCYLRALANVHQNTKEVIDDALRLLRAAIALDPEFAAAYGMAAGCYILYLSNGWLRGAEDIAEAARLARHAADLGRDDAVALCMAGITLATVVGEVEDGAAFIDRALKLNPNLSSTWESSAWAKIVLGEPEVAIEHAQMALRLNPLDPLTYATQAALAAAHFFAGRYDEASAWAEKSFREQPNFVPATRFAAASHALGGRLDRATAAMARLRRIDPELRVSNLHKLLPYRRREDTEKWAMALRLAGLPE
jgi:TolB-like protein/class 3 adenylate cyclase